MNRLGIACALFGLLVAVSGPPPRIRAVAFVNAGTEPVYGLRVLRAGSWSPDLLGPAEIIDVGDSRNVRIALTPHICRYKVRVDYGDGHANYLSAVNLCATQRLFVRH